MILNKIKVISSKNEYVIKDGVILAKPAGVTPSVGRDNKMYISYDLGLKLVIPTGMIALILPPNESSRFSVYQSGNFILMPGTHDNVIMEYKINTDAVPRVFEKDEVCAQIIFISTSNVEFETVIEEEKSAAVESKPEENKVSEPDNDEAMPAENYNDTSDPNEGDQSPVMEEGTIDGGAVSNI